MVENILKENPISLNVKAKHWNKKTRNIEIKKTRKILITQLISHDGKLLARFFEKQWKCVIKYRQKIFVFIIKINDTAQKHSDIKKNDLTKQTLVFWESTNTSQRVIIFEKKNVFDFG